MKYQALGNAELALSVPVFELEEHMSFSLALTFLFNLRLHMF